MADQFNKAQYARLMDEEYACSTIRWGEWSAEDRTEWKDVADQVRLKLGTRVMILRNLYGHFCVDEDRKVDTDAEAITGSMDFEPPPPPKPVIWNADGSIAGVTGDKVSREGLLQANGDTGVIERVTNGTEGIAFDVRRDDGMLIRVEMQKSDNGLSHIEIMDGGMRRKIVDKEPTAWIEYMPLAQCWASTVHKSQGATIEHPVRIFLADFFGNAMAYVAASRVKDPRNLTLLGDVDGIKLGEVTKSDYQCTDYR